ncbi:Hypothetical_protein [Hexamita inflata]|uniref:Hypothetical_protein n=1 Tax=Hexamita inflata TaxID=28002 RepID=A0AA86RNU4_9EUKA|nr:Hypothetical protein HINF_LOCUS64568 [Hexamita inflata]
MELHGDNSRMPRCEQTQLIKFTPMQRHIPQILRQIDGRKSIGEKYFSLVKNSEYVPGYMYQYTRCSFEGSLSTQTSMPLPATNQKLMDLKYLLKSTKETIAKVEVRIQRLNGFCDTTQRNIEIVAKNQLSLYSQVK